MKPNEIKSAIIMLQREGLQIKEFVVTPEVERQILDMAMSVRSSGNDLRHQGFGAAMSKDWAARYLAAFALAFLFVLYFLPPSHVGASTSQIPQQCVDSTGSGTTQTCTVVLGITTGDTFVYTPGTTNTGALTLNINSGGAKAVQKWLGGALVAGDLVAAKPVLATYDGTHYLVMTIGNAPTVTIASGSLALGTGSISAGSCNTETPPTATGVVSTDVPEWSANSDISATTGYAPGQLTIYTWPGSNVVNIKECNGTASPITPSAVTLNWHVTR